MTTLEYLKDNYLQRCEAVILTANPQDKTIILDHSTLHPKGGHQVSDHGQLILNGKELKINDCRLQGPDVLLYPDTFPEAVVPGATVTVVVDWPRRYRLMRLHTAQHLFSAVAARQLGLKTVDLNIGPQNCEIKFNRELSVDELLRLQDEVNLIASENLPVLRSIENGRWQVDIVGYDKRECGCTHVANTSELGKLLITSAKNAWIYFELISESTPTIAAWQQTQLSTQRILNRHFENPEDLPSAFKQLEEEQTELKKKLSAAGMALLTGKLGQTFGRGYLKVIDQPEVDIEQVRKALKQYPLKRGKLLIVRCTKGTVLVFSSNASKPATSVMTILKTADPEFKGGGNERFAQGGPWIESTVQLAQQVRLAFLEVCAYCD